MTLNADGTYSVGNAVPLVPGTNVMYDNATRVLTFVIPDNTKAYQFRYITYLTGNPGTVKNHVSLLGLGPEQETASASYIVTNADASATLQKNGWVEIVKTDGAGVPLAGAEFTLFAMDGTTVIRKGVTGTDGKVRLKVIPEGTFILRETTAPAGYTPEGVGHTVEVTKFGLTVTTSVDDKTGAGSETLAIKNYMTGTAGNLTISKAVAGTGADPTRTFDFTVTLTGAPGVYDYVGHGVPGGQISSGGTVSLAHGQSITIVGLPKDAAYTVTEHNYADDGYTTTSTGASGVIAADAVKTASFVNTRTVGSLTIGKTVAGTGADPAKKFNFTVAFAGNGASKTYSYVGNGVPNGTVASGDTIALAHGESITIVDLPQGLQYTVTEDDYADDGYATASAVLTGTIAADETQTAVFANTRTIGELKIAKLVAGDAADRNKPFNFTLTLTGNGASKTYDYIGDGVPNGMIASGDSFSLAHGQSITIVGLPNGMNYTVTEDDYSGEWYETTSTGAAGTIQTDTTRTAVFTNTRKVGNLTIGKTVSGNADDKTKSFNFTVTFAGNGDADTYRYIGDGVPDGTIRSGDVISLAHGQRIMIVELPEGLQYTVTEDDYSAEGYKTVSTGETGTIAMDETQTASFTNTRSVYAAPLGNLVITKTVTGSGADLDRKFDFAVTFSDVNGVYAYKGDGVPDGTIRSGDVIPLAHGQSITIEGLPAGTAYQVVEDAASSEGYIVESTGNSGTIQAFADSVAAFVNTKQPVSTGSLTIGKTVAGEGADLAKKCDFTVTFVGADDVYPYTGSTTGTIRSGDVISLAHGESITITGLPEGARYSVTEADYCADGYRAVSTGESGAITGGAEQTASFTNHLSLEPEAPGGDPSHDAGASVGGSQQTGSNMGVHDGIAEGDAEGDEDPNRTATAGNRLYADLSGSSSDAQAGGMPKTGDRSPGGPATLGLVGLSAVFAALLAADIALRRRGAGRRTGR
jgi:hypothetical protein